MDKAEKIFEKYKPMIKKAGIVNALGALMVPGAVVYGYQSKKKGESAGRGFGKSFLVGTTFGTVGTYTNLRQLAGSSKIISKKVSSALIPMVVGGGLLSGLAIGSYQGIGRLFTKKPLK